MSKLDANSSDTTRGGTARAHELWRKVTLAWVANDSKSTRLIYDHATPCFDGCELLVAELERHDVEVAKLRAQVEHWREARRRALEAGNMLKADLDKARAELGHERLRADALEVNVAVLHKERDKARAEVAALREQVDMNGGHWHAAWEEARAREDALRTEVAALREEVSALKDRVAGEVRNRDMWQANAVKMQDNRDAERMRREAAEAALVRATEERDRALATCACDALQDQRDEARRASDAMAKMLALVHAEHPQPEICDACKLLGRAPSTQETPR